LLLFLSSRPPPPLALHSFPTRRSSDLALFILSRHRDQLAHGDAVHESIGKSLATSGSAVIFAGLTVIIALVGLIIPASPSSPSRSEEHTSELQSRFDLVCRLLLEKKNT